MSERAILDLEAGATPPSIDVSNMPEHGEDPSADSNDPGGVKSDG